MKTPVFSKITKMLSYVVLILVIIVAYALSIQVTQPDMIKLVTSLPKARQVLDQLLVPDLVTLQTGTFVVSLTIPVPCGSAPAGEPQTTGPRITSTLKCATVKDKFVIEGFELGGNVEILLRWKLPDGKLMNLQRLTTDKDGGFKVEVQARPINLTINGVPSMIEVEANQVGGKWVLSPTVKDVVNNIFVTIFMALLATTFGTILAIPLSFLAASNITRKGCVGSGVYYVTRSILNLVRSYEPLVMATVFALIVGFGSPFAGVMALVLVTMASLGKMFSESVESIDPGPIEALNSTGANRLQVILYAVVPQIIPDFLSFTIYHWDINVRISTIIGFVGGGGIGDYLSQRINTFEYSKAGTALLAIILVVWSLDFLSAQVRKRYI